MPLHEAILSGYRNGFDVLFPHVNSVTVQDCLGRTPALVAVEAHKESMLEKLIERGADLNIEDDNDELPLDIVVKNNHYNIMNMLIRAGAKTEKWASNEDVLDILSAIEREKSR